MKRKPLHVHNSSLVHLLTFVAVIGLEINVLSTTAAAAAAAAGTANFQFDAINGTRTTAASAHAQNIATSVHAAAFPTSTTTTTGIGTATGTGTKTTTTITTTTTNQYGRNTSSVMGSNNLVGRSRTSTASLEIGQYAVGAGSSTASSTLKTSKSTSKYPMEPMNANHWTSLDTMNFGLPATTSSTFEVDRPRTFRNKHHHEHHWGPFFEEPLAASASGDNLVSTAHLFTEAALNCRVGMLKDKTVMWVRRTTEKVSLLTVGNVTYSGDPRIRVKFQYPNNWRLLINPTQREDAGVYMCQVSTHPPRVFTTNLTILEPPLRLIDEQEREVGDRYYKSGSTIDLQCQVSRSFILKEKLNILKSIQPLNSNQTKLSAQKANVANQFGFNDVLLGKNQTLKLGQQIEKPFNNFIFWKKDDDPLPPSAIKRSSVTEKWLNSRISIPDARLTDSGNYSCAVGKLFMAIVQVQVLTGELPAAVQHNSAVPSHRGGAPLHPLNGVHFIVAFAFIVVLGNISPAPRINIAAHITFT